MNRRVTRSLPLCLVVLAACVSPGSNVAGEGANPMSDPDYLLRQEILDSNATMAYDLVRSRRPQWLQTRGVQNVRQLAGEQGIVVYRDNARMGGVEALRGMGLGDVQYVRFMSATQATQRWGANHMNGAILVSTRPR